MCDCSLSLPDTYVYKIDWSDKLVAADGAPSLRLPSRYAGNASDCNRITLARRRRRLFALERTYVCTHSPVRCLHWLVTNFSPATADEGTASDVSTHTNVRVDIANAFRHASSIGELETLKVLHTGFGITSEDVRADQNDALRSAAANGHVDVLRYLHTEFGLTREDVRADQNDALQRAAANGHVDVLRYLHTEFGLTIEDVRSALRRAAANGQVDVLRNLNTEFGAIQGICKK